MELQFFGCCRVSRKSIILTALLVPPKLELISIIERSLRRDKPAASFKMLITLMFFKYKQKVFLCFIISSLNGSFKNENIWAENLNCIMQLNADDYLSVCVLCGTSTRWQTLYRHPHVYYLPYLSLNIILCTDKKKMLPISLCHMLYHSELHLTLNARTLRLT